MKPRKDDEFATEAWEAVPEGPYRRMFPDEIGSYSLVSGAWMETESSVHVEPHKAAASFEREVWNATEAVFVSIDQATFDAIRNGVVK